MQAHIGAPLGQLCNKSQGLYACPLVRQSQGTNVTWKRRSAKAATSTTRSIGGTTGTYNNEEVDAMPPLANTTRVERLHRTGVAQSEHKPLVKPEVLSPAGGWPQVKAAVENGADAVYFGTPDFNARARASNFEVGELKELMTYLHARGVKGYVALNVLVFDEELEALEERIRDIAASGVDALIVQDLGAVELVRRVAPGLHIHGSTQMSITSAQGAQFAAGLGVERVVVGRELSIREIAKVREQSTTEVEAFVHGALCVSYSGQCFSSEAWGGRSANRGQCAQACRLPYGLIVDGVLKDLQDVSYLLSPQDLMAVSHVPELIQSGVGCFKIEGRLKGPEYVALTTQVYRRAVDAAWAALTGEGSSTKSSDTNSTKASNTSSRKTSGRESDSPGSSSIPSSALTQAKASVALTQQQQWDLKQVFARGQDAEFNGLTPGFLEGPRHQQLVRGRAPKHRGAYAGTVVRVVRQNSQSHQQQQQQCVRSNVGTSSSGRGGGADANNIRGCRQRSSNNMNNAVGGDRRGGRGQRVPGGSQGAQSYGSTGAERAASSGSSVAVVIELACPLKRGDGLVFDAGQAEQLEEGGAVYDLQDSQGRQLTRGVVPPLAHVGIGNASLANKAVPAPDAHVTQLVTVVFGPGQLDPSRIQEGQLVWRTKDAGLESRLRASYEGLAAANLRRQAVHARVSGQLGQPMTMTLRDASGHEVTVHSAAALAPALHRPMVEEDVVRAAGVTLGGAGDNTLVLASTDFSGLQLDQGLFMPVSDLKSLRRAATDALLAAREEMQAQLQDRLSPAQGVLASMLNEVAQRATHVASDSLATTSNSRAATTTPSAPNASVISGSNSGHFALKRAEPDAPVAPTHATIAHKKGGGRRQSAGQGKEASINVLCRTPEQVQACLTIPWLQEVIIDFLEVQGLWEAVASVKQANKRVIVATPRILKPNEEPLVAFYLRLRANALLLRSTGLLYTLTGTGGPGSLIPGLLDPKGNPVHVPELHGDFSLNVANVLSADLLLRGSSLSRVAPTHDLSAPQICGLATALGPACAASSLDVILHQHLPIFHTEHCVFCRFLSSGNSYKDCGHPCEQHKVHLRDEKGADHLVLADMGCRNTVFNAQAQSGAFYAQDLIRAGVRKFRIELVDESGSMVTPLIQGYRDLLDGSRSPGDLWSWMRSLSKAGVGAGSLEGARARDRGASTLRSTAAALREEARHQSNNGRASLIATPSLTTAR